MIRNSSDKEVMWCKNGLIEMDDAVSLLEIKSKEQGQVKGLLNASTESVILLDRKGTIIEINDVAAQRLNDSVDNLVNKSMLDILPPRVSEFRKNKMYELLYTRKPIRFQDQRMGRSYDNNMYPVLDSFNRVIAVAVYAKDITDAIRKDKALYESELQYRMLVETMSEGLGITDEYGVITYINERYCDMIGYPKTEILGNPVSRFLDDENKKILKHQLSERKKGITGSYEIKWTRKDKQKFTTMMSARPIYDEGHNIIGSFAIITDIQKLKSLEKTLRASEEKYRSLVETTLDLVWEMDANGLFSYINPNIKTLLGYEAENIIGQPFSRILARHEMESATNIFEEAFKLKNPVDVLEVTHMHKNGSGLVFEINAVPVFDHDGVFSGCKGISRDITKRKYAEERLKESEMRYRTMIEYSPDAITVSQDGLHKLINTEFTRLFGYTQQDLEKGLDYLTIVKDKDKKFLGERMLKRVVGENLSPEKLSVDFIAKDGKKIPCETSAAQIQFNGRLAALVIIRDIRERRQAEQELKKKAKDIEETNIALKVLLKHREEDKSVHEEKVISNIQKLVMPYLEKLKSSRLDEKQKTYISIIEKNLEDISAPFARRLSSEILKLTPAEIQVSNLVKQGRTTKEIAHLLYLSVKTIEAHRKNIRAKLGIKNKKANLRTHLMNIDNQP